MPRVKIELDPGQTPEEAEEQLLKAMSIHRDGGAHEEDRFEDPAMQHQADLMVQGYETILDRMLDEISDVIDGS